MQDTDFFSANMITDDYLSLITDTDKITDKPTFYALFFFLLSARKAKM